MQNKYGGSIRKLNMHHWVDTEREQNLKANFILKCKIAIKKLATLMFKNFFLAVIFTYFLTSTRLIFSLDVGGSEIKIAGFLAGCRLLMITLL